MSMRYHVPNEIHYFFPEKDAVRQQVGKPGAYSFEPMKYPEAAHSEVVRQFSHVYKIAEDAYRTMLKMGIAKELARSVLPVGQYTEFIWTVNARSLMNFLCLRNDEHAQREIAEYASGIEDIFASMLPETHKAWVATGRQSI